MNGSYNEYAASVNGPDYIQFDIANMAVATLFNTPPSLPSP